MAIWACSSDVCTQRPTPVTSRSSSAVRTPSAQYSPAALSATAMPARTGPWPGSPVTDISPPMPWATWSKPGRIRYGPSSPNPEMLP